MTFRMLAAATALSFGLSVAAQAQPTLSTPAAVAPATAPAEAPRAAAPAKPAAATASVKPAGYRSAEFGGGNGATWKTGRDAYGFMGAYGGCRYSGHAGPGGYRIDRAC